MNEQERPSASPARVGFVGPLRGDLDDAAMVLDALASMGVRQVVQLGELGFDASNPLPFQRLKSLLRDRGQWMDMIDGAGDPPVTRGELGWPYSFAEGQNLPGDVRRHARGRRARLGASVTFAMLGGGQATEPTLEPADLAALTPRPADVLAIHTPPGDIPGLTLPTPANDSEYLAGMAMRALDPRVTVTTGEHQWLRTRAYVRPTGDMGSSLIVALPKPTQRVAAAVLDTPNMAVTLVSGDGTALPPIDDVTDLTTRTEGRWRVETLTDVQVVDLDLHAWERRTATDDGGDDAIELGRFRTVLRARLGEPIELELNGSTRSPSTRHAQDAPIIAIDLESRE